MSGSSDQEESESLELSSEEERTEAPRKSSRSSLRQYQLEQKKQRARDRMALGPRSRSRSRSRSRPVTRSRGHPRLASFSRHKSKTGRPERKAKKNKKKPKHKERSERSRSRSRSRSPRNRRRRSTPASTVTPEPTAKHKGKAKKGEKGSKSTMYFGSELKVSCFPKGKGKNNRPRAPRQGRVTPKGSSIQWYQKGITQNNPTDALKVVHEQACVSAVRELAFWKTTVFEETLIAEANPTVPERTVRKTSPNQPCTLPSFVCQWGIYVSSIPQCERAWKVFAKQLDATTRIVTLQAMVANGCGQIPLNTYQLMMAKKEETPKPALPHPQFQRAFSFLFTPTNTVGVCG